MDYDDRLTIATPEGVELNLTLAGVGSRFASALIDVAIQAVLIIAVSLVAAAVGSGFGLAIGSIAAFLIVFGYDVLFEVLASGRTPGKRANGLRVVRSGGQPIELVASVIRNMLRIVDFLPTAYLVGIVSILATKRNQRLGDLVAGTLVVRERLASIAPPAWAPAPQLPPSPEPGAVLDVGLVTAEEVAALRHYMERRLQIEPQVRRELAHTLAERLRPKVGGVPDDLRGEPLLAAVLAEKLARHRPA